MRDPVDSMLRWLLNGDDPATFVGLVLVVIGFMITLQQLRERLAGDDSARSRWYIAADFTVICLGGIGGVVFAQLHGNFPAGASGIAAIVYFVLAVVAVVVMLLTNGWESTTQLSIIGVGLAAIGVQLGEYYAASRFAWLAPPLHHIARGAAALFLVGLGMYLLALIYDFVRAAMVAALANWRNQRNLSYMMRHPQGNAPEQQPVENGAPPTDDGNGPGRTP